MRKCITDDALSLFDLSQLARLEGGLLRGMNFCGTYLQAHTDLPG